MENEAKKVVASAPRGGPAPGGGKNPNNGHPKPNVVPSKPAMAAPPPPKPGRAPGNGAPPGPTGGKIEVIPSKLSPSLARDLARIPVEEWNRIESVLCHLNFSRDMAEGVRFVDAVATWLDQKDGVFATRNPERRRELEECSEKILEAFRALIRTTAEVARRLMITDPLARHWWLCSMYGRVKKKPNAPGEAPQPNAAAPP